LLNIAESQQLDHLEISIGYTTEMDEFWSFVQTKANQRWTWYALEKQTGIIVSWHNGKRTTEDLKILLTQMSNIPIKKYYTDHWDSYAMLLPSIQHIQGKDQTWQIERKNLNFRTHIKRLNRRTICYSKNEKIHDNVIGMYIERYYYKTGLYSNNDFNGFDP
jgi:insertion element IS1 protein InsB